jgi:transketolase
MGHIGGALSISDLLAVLYFERMRVDPKDPKKPDRDRLVLSKGHAGPGLYAALSLKGYFPEEMLYTLNKPDTLLPSHCDMQRTPGVDMTAGSLGQGLSCAVGMALGANLKGLDSHIYAILSEGCCQEGSTWEAAMYAGSKKVSNLTVFVDRNGLQIDGNVDEINSLQNLAAKWNAFGWKAINVADGHDIEQIIDALDNRDIRGPTAIILKTVKGKGISFLEGQVLSHHAILDESQWRAAIEELEGGGLNA